MVQLNPYLTFNGNCREAMSFYKDCLGGELNLQTIGESPVSDKMPEKMKACILHGVLTTGTLTLMATDCVPETLFRGNTISLCLNFNNEDELRTCFEKLSAGGKTNQAPEDTFWGALFGDLTDRYGNHWLLNFSRNQS